MTINLDPTKLAELENLVLDSGSHDDFNDGHCAMEVVSWLADEGFTDAPQCASPILARYTIALNDRWDDEKRQALKPYLVRMIGTGGDGKDHLRTQIALAETQRLAVPWLRLAGLDEHADRVEQATTRETVRDALWKARTAS